jgi:Tfp pilus assembly protein PilF
MSADRQQIWAERTVQAVNHAFSDFKDTKTRWARYQRCIPHAQACLVLIEQWQMTSPAAARLLNHTGAFLRDCGQFPQAETVLRKALDIAMPTSGPEHPEVAQNLYDLGRLHLDQGTYRLVEPLLQQALAIREKRWGVPILT